MKNIISDKIETIVKNRYFIDHHLIFRADIEKITSHKPELIIYGVGFRDIGHMENISCSNNEIPSYIPKISNQEIISKIFTHNYT